MFSDRVTGAFCASSLIVTLFISVSYGETPDGLRRLIEARIGSLHVLQVPAADADMPQPDDPRYRITPQKKRLGKLLFFDPVRSNNVRPEFGGVRALAQSISCGTCHIGAAASKAGTQQAFGMGGQGRGAIDPETGRFVARRVPYADLVDVLPTPIDVFDGAGQLAMSGRFDGLDGPARSAPSVIGFATNLRMFWSGPAGEPYDPADPGKVNINPDDLPAGESTVMFTFMAHRMIGTQRFALQDIPAYVELYRRAFPTASAAADASGNPDDLINDDTTARAIAAFLRTVITRDTPYDRFLAGSDTSLSAGQLRGAELFFSAPEDGGANCVACHSGPALNKTLGDEAGRLIEENFRNVGIGDHPMMDLARTTLGDSNVADIGRAEATGDAADNFRFKSPTLRQARDAGPYMHSGELETLRDLVEYFNNGAASSELAAAAGNVDDLFTHPRGPGQIGLGLSDDDLTALVDFLENGLYDPAFVVYDAGSPTETFDLNAADLTYDRVLKRLGAVDGKVPSLLPHPQTDAMSVQDIAAEPTPSGTCGLLDTLSLFGMVAPLTLVSVRRRRRP